MSNSILVHIKDFIPIDHEWQNIAAFIAIKYVLHVFIH